MNFDQIVDRKPTFSFKWQKYKGQDVLPMWVADTEFRCAQPILDALTKRIEHGVLGYTLPAQYEPAKQAVADWLSRRYDWQIELDWIVWMPGVVPGFNVACKACCEPGDKVMIQVPNYPPLLAAPQLNQLQRADIPTLEQDGRWMLDFDELEKQAADPATKLFVLCNPMNPVGTVLTEQELARVADICQRNGVTLCSDEIHCDLILDDQASHLPAGKLEALKSNSITLMAASKTFNIAGLGAAFAIIPDARLRRQFNQAAMGIVPWVNVLGLYATEAAFTQCDDWYEAQLDYLRGNRDYLVEQINQIEGLQLISPQATFLAWIDASGLGMDNPQRWFEDRGVGPSPGADFGDKQFVRINFGSPREYLREAINRIKRCD
ncbi:MalY/PatB family protein [Lacimicrobium alkaliphilum]|uniref:cysteine-S-conjugate beta-lyase n=1 Tax=Lacimicrobium alkaliphilum TaxID=1526571 RepID=A0A0U3AT31_9ALTE|nr:PatB family C-S lyase [Lacimicrobium alkaliphilum]ALS97247.1 aminotransferase class I/II [Lacimicrobium alkaliphilum]